MILFAISNKQVKGEIIDFLNKIKIVFDEGYL